MRDPLDFAAPGSASVTTVSSELVAANPFRKYLVITNLADVPIYLGIGEAAVVGKGVVLTTIGADYEFMVGQNLTLEAITGIHGAVGVLQVAVQEANHAD